MTATFAPATPGGVPLILGIAGPSRSGKTYSALRIALGLVGGEPSRVFVIDTERGRARQYADKFGGFMHCLLDPPFAYSRYAEMIAAAVKDGAGVVVVDSASHAHEGEGGMLDQHEAELDRMAGGQTGRSASRPNSRHGSNQSARSVSSSISLCALRCR